MTRALEASPAILRRDRAAWLARALWVLTLALVAAGYALLAVSRSVRLDSAVDLGGRIPVALFALAFSSVGARVAARRPHNAIGWLFIATGLAWAGQVFRTLLRRLRTPRGPRVALPRRGVALAAELDLASRCGPACHVRSAVVPGWTLAVATLAAGRVGDGSRNRACESRGICAGQSRELLPGEPLRRQRDYGSSHRDRRLSRCRRRDRVRSRVGDRPDLPLPACDRSGTRAAQVDRLRRRTHRHRLPRDFRLLECRRRVGRPLPGRRPDRAPYLRGHRNPPLPPVRHRPPGQPDARLRRAHSGSRRRLRRNGRARERCVTAPSRLVGLRSGNNGRDRAGPAASLAAAATGQQPHVRRPRRPLLGDFAPRPAAAGHACAPSRPPHGCRDGGASDS